MKEEIIIDVKNLSRDFKTPVRKEGMINTLKSLFNRKFKIKKAVDKVSFEVRKGEIVGLLGPNGAGKSTTIKVLTGILKETSGQVTILGYNPFNDRRDYVMNIGAMFGQKSQLWWHIPPADSFELSRHMYDIPKDVFEKRKKLMIDQLGVENVIHQPARSLSLGERMKCEFIMALLHNPKIIFLDEPTIGLDVFAKDAIRKFIKYVNEKFNTTVILTTHDMDDIEHLAERVIVISGGKKVFDNSMQNLKKIAGKKKTIRVVVEKPIKEIKGKGIARVKKLSDHEFLLTLDRSILSLNKFISSVTKNNSIFDLTVSDREVEDIIKDIYKKSDKKL